jgi:hypothetical protein
MTALGTVVPRQAPRHAKPRPIVRLGKHIRSLEAQRMAAVATMAEITRTMIIVDGPMIPFTNQHEHAYREVVRLEDEIEQLRYRAVLRRILGTTVALILGILLLNAVWPSPPQEEVLQDRVIYQTVPGHTEEVTLPDCVLLNDCLLNGGLTEVTGR